MKELGINHHKIAPLHPKVNAMAENFMRNLKQSVADSCNRAETMETSIV